jgi:hypothetical protein
MCPSINVRDSTYTPKFIYACTYLHTYVVGICAASACLTCHVDTYALAHKSIWFRALYTNLDTYKSYACTRMNA